MDAVSLQGVWTLFPRRSVSKTPAQPTAVRFIPRKNLIIRRYNKMKGYRGPYHL